MKKKILIVGNGFDLDLGIKSRYSDFMDSEIWTNAYENIQSSGPLLDNNILEYLISKKKVKKWFDIEDALLSFALTRTKDRVIYRQCDEVYFSVLCNALKKYLRNEEKTFSQNNFSKIPQLMQAIEKNGYFSAIYTFNYTDISHILGVYGINIKTPVTYMHGSLREDDDIILGIDTDEEIKRDYTFLFKTNSKFYTSNRLLDDLSEADEVIFFGHSINGMDFPYFRDFFIKQSLPSDSAIRKKITFFTYNTASSRQIRDNLRNNQVNPRELYSRNEIVFVETNGLSGDAVEIQKFEELITHLSTRQ